MVKHEKTIIVGRGKFTQTYTLLENHYFIEFRVGVLEEQFDPVLKKLQLEPISISLPISPVKKPKNEKERRVGRRRWVKALKKVAISDLDKINIIRRVAPVYVESEQSIESAVAPLPDALILEIPQEPSEELLKTLKEKFDLHAAPRIGKPRRKFRYFQIGENGKPKFTAYEIIDQIQELKEVSFAEFDWVVMMPDLFIPNDTHWGDQWDMIRINSVGGWDLETGDSTIIIAILDSGCDLNHPDLTYTPVADHYNAIEALPPNSQLPPYDAGPIRPHGTAVAGIAAADLDNAQGVAGVAGGCLILPAYHGDNSAGEAAAIDWAVDHGANVINMSSRFPSTADLENAVQNADAAGVVLVAAAGNDNLRSIIYPARYPEVIAVGASDQNDERKRPASPDGECWWGSNYGDELDVMAPGVLVWTTDELGLNGYNDNNGAPFQVNATCGTVNYPTTGDAAGDYFSNFNGTSAATPHVAGLAALLLSRYPRLTNHQVRDIIERTCRKVSPGTYAYAQEPGRPNGSWHEEMGYGLISVQCALRYASRYYRVRVPPFGEILEGVILGEQLIDIERVAEVIVDWSVFDPMPDIIRLIYGEKEPQGRIERLEAEYQKQLRRYQQQVLKLREELRFHRRKLLQIKRDIYKEFWKTIGK